MRGASNENAEGRDPPRVNSALIRVYINGQELLALLDKGCEVDLVSEETARRCKLPVHSLAQSLRLRFADGRQNARIDKATRVKCQFQSEMGTNLIHPTKCRRKPRAGREVPISAKGRKVGAAQVPAHTPRGPALASSQYGNILKECERIS